MPHDSPTPAVQESVFDFSNPQLYNPVYIPTFKRKEPYLHYFGSAGSGKSVFVAQKEVVLSFQPWRGRRKTLVARRYYNSLGYSCYALLKSIIYQWNLDDCFHFNRSPYSILNKQTGHEFIFIGLDDVEKVKSITGVDRGWLEEATEVKKKDDLDQLGTRLRGYKNVQWTLTYNPTDAEHWLNQEVHIPQLAGHFVFKTTYLDNIRLLEIDPGYGERMEAFKETNPNHWRVYAKGYWGKHLEGLVYPDYEEVGEMPEIHAYGLDLGWNDPVAMCKVALVDEYKKDRKQLYVEEMIYEVQMDIPRFLAKIADLKVSKRIPIIYDPAQPGPLFGDALREAGYWAIAAEKGPGSVKAGIAKVKEFNLRPVGGGKNLFAELNGHSWKNKNGVWLDEPDKGLDHLLDGMRYATWHLDKPSSSGSEEVEEWI